MHEIYRVVVSQSDQTRAGLALHLVAASTGVPPIEATGRGRLGPRGCRARWLAMYLAHVGFGWPLDRVAHAFGMNRSAARHACRWGEDARDRPALDELLDRLEGCIRAIYDGPPLEILA